MSANTIDKWNKVLEHIKGQVTQLSFHQWFENLELSSLDNENRSAVFIADNLLVKNLVTGRYFTVLSNSFNEVFEGEYDIHVVLKGEENKPIPKVKAFKDYEDEFIFNPRFTFDTFVVGDHNNLANAAARAVAEEPSKVFNPLFIYGGSGLGKTHLLHAIGCYVMEHYPEKKILFVSSEMFTNEFIDSLKDSNRRKSNSFREKYRNQDVLLIDDVQFIEKKEQTEIEMFNTFNELINYGKQIVLSSDRPPSKLTKLDERLSSRFEKGAVSITPPDFETRVAILKKKAEMENLEIDETLMDVITLISEKIKFNVRILESAFLRVVRFSELIKEPITVKLATKVLKDTLETDEISINPEYIKKKVCRKFGLKISDMESAKRTRSIAYPRQICMYLCRELTDMSYPQIGKFFGNRDHSTVLHAYEKISSDMKSDEELKNTVNSLISDIKNE